MPSRSIVLTLAVCFAVSLVASACTIDVAAPVSSLAGSGRIVTEERSVGGFAAVTLAGEGNVIITSGERAGITIEADDNLLPLITTEVRDGVLIIGKHPSVGRQSFAVTRPIVYRVSMTAVRALTLAGAGTLTAENVSADRLSVSLTGTGEVKVSGRAAEQIVTLNGAGHIDTRGLQTVKTEATLNGAGHIVVWATERLTATINAAGTIQYLGSPTVKKMVSAVGGVSALDAARP
jgi:hypothetical protein